MSRLPFVLALCLCGAGALLSAGPQSWRVATQADFLKGDLEQLAVDEHGRVTLGPAITTVYDTGVPFVWTAASDAAGTTYLGTGNDGKVFRIDAQGRGTLFYDAPEQGVYAMAAAPGGGLFVATSPDGRVYKVDAAGTAAPFFDPDERYIWALHVDASGQVFVATGDPKGRVYRVSPAGAGQPFYTGSATHVTALAADAERRLVVGTESPGRVFRLDADGRPFLLLDTAMQEVRAIRRDTRGRLFVVAQAARTGGDGGGDVVTPSTPEPARAPVPNVTVSITSMSVVDTGAATPASTPTKTEGPVAGALFRIDTDGASERIWEMRDDTPYDVAPQDDGALLVATGHRGKLFRLDGDPWRATLLGRVGGREALQFLPAANGRTLIATANGGALVRVDAGHASRGTWTSDVRDAKGVARWGAVSWRATTPAGARVEVSTRTGNTATPDEAWSAWSPAYGDSEGSPNGSPTARYLQWRVTLSGTGESPVLTAVAAAYLQKNQRPVVSGIVVHPPGVVFQKPFSTGETEIAGYRAEAAEKRLSNQGQPPVSTAAPTLGRRTFQQGLQTIVWKGDDANSDDLVYDVAWRREGEATWTPLVSGLTEAIYVWDTASVPSGRYLLRITASDAPTQPADQALRGDAESPSVDVDTVAPVVTLRPAAGTGGRLAMTVEVRDQQSTVATVEYAVDGGAWQAAYPADGMLDSRAETLTLTFPNEARGKTLVVRATDALHNVGVGDAVIRP